MCCRRECQFQYWEGWLSHRNGLWDMWECLCLVLSVGRRRLVVVVVGVVVGSEKKYLLSVVVLLVVADRVLRVELPFELELEFVELLSGDKGIAFLKADLRDRVTADKRNN